MLFHSHGVVFRAFNTLLSDSYLLQNDLGNDRLYSYFIRGHWQSMAKQQPGDPGATILHYMLAYSPTVE